MLTLFFPNLNFPMVKITQVPHVAVPVADSAAAWSGWASPAPPCESAAPPPSLGGLGRCRAGATRSRRPNGLLRYRTHVEDGEGMSKLGRRSVFFMIGVGQVGE